MFRFHAAPPLSLYIHFPWCVRKCPYCDFNSHSLRDELPEDAYVDALLRDLELELPAVWGRPIQTIFMGGGTPSLFSAQAIDRLLSGIRARLPLRPDLEVTLEANPGTVERERFAAYREAGVNRLSIGVQSLDDRHLNALGRIHDAAQAVEAAHAARAAGFDNFNMDMMFGLPEQSIDQALHDLTAAIELRPDHLSWYQLTLEPNTLFAARPPTLPDDDQKGEMQQLGQLLCARSGYTQYEVSAFAQPGKACRHNRNYWCFGDYIGIGAGAHGKITDAGRGVIRRIWKKRQPAAYLKSVHTGGAIDGHRVLSESEAVFEFALNRFRLTQPFTLNDFEAGCGLESGWITPVIRRAQVDGLLNFDGERVEHTAQGWLFLNDLLERFLPEAAQNARDRQR
ncbi:MAG: radical SAM family heme chaperone HemW [Thiogranum sp.]|nr:radical SAM family heme chaperone HemW [Thiogranum sp.]